MAIQIVGLGLRQGAAVPDRVRSSRAEPEPPWPRQAFFGGDGNGHAAGWVETPVLRRSDLANPRNGPLIVEEYDSTCVVPPGATASLDAGGNIVIVLG